MSTLQTMRVLPVGGRPLLGGAVAAAQALARWSTQLTHLLHLVIRGGLALAVGGPLVRAVAAGDLATVASLCGLLLPLLLLVGLGARLVALALIALHLAAAAAPAGLGGAWLPTHPLWPLLLAVVLVHGPGAWSLDHLLRQHYLADEPV